MDTKKVKNEALNKLEDAQVQATLGAKDAKEILENEKGLLAEKAAIAVAKEKAAIDKKKNK